jgi:hypothetical protein
MQFEILDADPKIIAQILYEKAEDLTNQIESLENPATARQNPTPRRARILSSMQEKANKLKKYQFILRELARRQENNLITPLLDKIRSKQDLEYVVSSIDFKWDFPSNPETITRLNRLGVNQNNFAAFQIKIDEILQTMGKEDPRTIQLRELETALIGTKIEGFFPTPIDVVNQLLDLAEITSNDLTILEPSGGKGDIADVIADQFPNNSLSVCEINQTLRAILELKGYNLLTERDFLKISKKFDRIIMNPPFETNQDIVHVRHAYSLLNPGGIVVSIMGEGTFFRESKTEVDFRDWLQSQDSAIIDLPAGAFAKPSVRPTQVKTRIVVLKKPQEKTVSLPKIEAKVSDFGLLYTNTLQIMDDFLITKKNFPILKDLDIDQNQEQTVKILLDYFIFYIDVINKLEGPLQAFAKISKINISKDQWKSQFEHLIDKYQIIFDDFLRFKIYIKMDQFYEVLDPTYYAKIVDQLNSMQNNHKTKIRMYQNSYESFSVQKPIASKLTRDELTNFLASALAQYEIQSVEPKIVEATTFMYHILLKENKKFMLRGESTIEGGITSIALTNYYTTDENYPIFASVEKSIPFQMLIQQIQQFLHLQLKTKPLPKPEIKPEIKVLTRDDLRIGENVYFYSPRIKELIPAKVLRLNSTRATISGYQEGALFTADADYRLISKTKTMPPYVIETEKRKEEALTWKFDRSGLNSEAHLLQLLKDIKEKLLPVIEHLFTMRDRSLLNSLTIQWGDRMTIRRMGWYNPLKNLIQIEKVLKDTPAFVIQQTIWHEILHIHFNPHAGEQAHGTQFHIYEHQCPQFQEANKYLHNYLSHLRARKLN